MLQQYLLWCYIFVFFHCICGFLDFEELKTVDYRFNLVDTPVVKSEETLSSEIYMTSIHGQPYQCTFPMISDQKKKEKEDEQAAVETGISELLKPMQDGPCLIYNKGWWTYEFCYGKEVKQYHMEDQKVQGKIISLGVYESEFDWNNATDKRKNSLNRYHSQHYVNGSLCDLNGKPRKSEIRFMCEEGSGDHISRIDEPESCGYIITVQTTKICHHPYLKPPVKSKPVPITCNPLLSQAEFDEYQAEVDAERLAKEEAVVRYRENMQKEADELKRMQQQLKDKESELKDLKDESEEGSENEEAQLAEETSTDLSSHEGVNKAMEQLQNLLSDTLAKGLQDAMEEYGLEDEDNVEMTMRYIEDPKDLRKVMNDMLTEQKEKITKRLKGNKLADEKVEGKSTDGETSDNVDENTHPSEHASGNVVTDEDEEDGIVEVEDEDEEAVDEFEDGLNKVAPTPGQKGRISKYKDNINSAMQAQFSNILEEAKRELSEEGIDTSDVDNAETYEKLTQTLNKILGKLEKSANTIQTKSESKDHTDSEDTETEPKDYIETAEEESTGDEDEDDDDSIEDSIEEENDLSTKPDGPADDAKAKDTEDGSKVISRSSRRSLEERTQDFEGKVKKTLEKALNVNGRKVEVRIVTAVTDEDGTIHMTADGDASNMNKMMFALLGDNEDEIREAQKQQQMESAYGFNWKGKGEKDKEITVEEDP